MMKKLLKGFSLFLLLALIVAPVVTPLNVSAQETDDDIYNQEVDPYEGIPAEDLDTVITEEVPIGFNTQPQVQVKDLVLDKASYATGDTATGYIVVENSEAVSYPEIYFEISFNGDYGEAGEWGVPNITYDYKMIGPYKVDAGGDTKVNFSFEIPWLITGDDLGITVVPVLLSGERLPMKTNIISVAGETSNILHVDNVAVIDGDDNEFEPHAGPIVSNDEDVKLKVTISNDNNENVDFSINLGIYDRQNLNKPTRTAAFSNSYDFSIEANKTKDFIIDLPTGSDMKDAVYVGEIELVGLSQYKIGNVASFRYILGGDVVTISDVVIDKEFGEQGEIVTLKMNIQGPPHDIETGETNNLGNGNVLVRLTNENGDVVAEKMFNQDLNQYGYFTFPLELKEKAGGLSVQVEVYSGTNDLLTSYGVKLSDKVGGDVDTDTSKTLINIVIALIAVIVLVFIVSKFKGKDSNINIPTAAIMIICIGTIIAGFLFINKNDAEATFVVTDRTKWGWTKSDIDYPAVSTNSPNAKTGEKFWIQMTVAVSSCANSTQNLDGWLGGEQQTYLSGAHIWNFSGTRAYGPFTRNKPGRYTIGGRAVLERETDGVLSDGTVWHHSVSAQTSGYAIVDVSCQNGYVRSGDSCVPAPANGQCSTTVDQCSTGNPDLSPADTDYGSRHNWNCSGVNGGSATACTACVVGENTNIPAPTINYPTDGGSVPAGNQTITWSAVSGIDTYALRINDLTTGTGNPWGSTASEGDVVVDVTGTSYTYDFQFGHTYDIWVHSKSPDCGAWSEANIVTNITVTGTCTEDVWSCGAWSEWSSCDMNGKQTSTRICDPTFDCPNVDTPPPTTTREQDCSSGCTEDVWSCDEWGACINGNQTRTCELTLDCGEDSTNPYDTSQSCTNNGTGSIDDYIMNPNVYTEGEGSCEATWTVSGLNDSSGLTCGLADQLDNTVDGAKTGGNNGFDFSATGIGEGRWRVNCLDSLSNETFQSNTTKVCTENPNPEHF